MLSFRELRIHLDCQAPKLSPKINHEASFAPLISNFAYWDLFPGLQRSKLDLPALPQGCYHVPFAR